ncbi:hypothetical protein EMGBS6_00200 [Opitutia bacterium]|nr:hypothetical protein EMGBS6_00200 [Opitutae bacterium]
MNTPHIATKTRLDRRAFLRNAGLLLTLPWLEAMVPSFANAAESRAAVTQPRRFLAMNYSLGFHVPLLVPKEEGRGYAPSYYLEPLQAHREDFTVFSGISHDEQNGSDGHTSELTWLTSAKHPGLPGFRNTISLDQLLVQKLNPDTRFSSLVLSAGNHASMSWTMNGVCLPAEPSPSKVFQLLFVEGSPGEVKRQLADLRRGRSILDTIGEEARKLNANLGPRDKEKVDQYFTSVRELEARLLSSSAWATRPKPKVDAVAPKDVADRTDIIAKTRLMHEMITLAFQTDSTRFITYSAGGMNATPKIDGVSQDWHNLSHHGQDEAKIEELRIIERAEFNEIARLLGLLKGVKEGRGTLLDHTIVMAGSNLGNASAHSTRDLPLIVAGGGFRHGQHVVAGGKGNDNARFANLFVQIAHRMDVGLEKFGSSNGRSIKGFELA